ncbi:MAG TPA: PAS domain-containing protein [Cytophagaceae bacterium]|jgi:PAS domain S-box-containing protein|nr:PAS domain-containing protein [Cytophagaceae bacterium]
MADNSFEIILRYDKKIAKMENKLKYLEAILDNIGIDKSLESMLAITDYKNSPFYKDNEGSDDIVHDKTKIFLKVIIESMPFPVFIKDENCTYQLVNTLEANLFSIPEEEIIGRNDEYFIRDKDELHLIKETDEKVLRTNTAIELPEQSFSLPNGSSYSFKTHKIPFFNPITGKTNILGFSMDVTDSLQLNHLKKIVLLCSNPLL